MFFPQSHLHQELRFRYKQKQNSAYRVQPEKNYIFIKKSQKYSFLTYNTQFSTGMHIN